VSPDLLCLMVLALVGEMVKCPLILVFGTTHCK